MAKMAKRNILAIRMYVRSIDNFRSLNRADLHVRENFGKSNWRKVIITWLGVLN